MAKVGETLTITIDVDEKGASQKLDDIIAKVRELGEASKSGDVQHLKEVTKTLTRLASASAGLTSAAKSIGEISKATAGLVRNLQDIGTKQVGNATKKIARMGDAFEKMKDAATSTSSGSTSGVSQGTVSGMSIASKLAQSLATDFKRAAHAGMQLARLPFKMLLSPMQGVVTKAMGMANSFGRLFHTIGRVAFMRAIRAGIKMVTAAVREGISALYDWASVVGDSFMGTMDTMSTSFNYLRNSIAAMISPLLDALAPALDFIIDKIVSVINIFNQLIATLTGASTWRRAEKVATSYGDAASDAAKNTKKANNAAKELRNTLLGFDEINRLDAPDKSGSSASPGSGSGSGSSGAGALAFTEQPISQQVLDFAKMLREAWDRADFTAIGDMIGQKLGDMMMRVPWEEKIQPAVTKIAKSFGTLLNGMFDYNGKGGKAMWDGIAYTAYNALNTALLGYTTFFSTVRWEGIGQGFGAALKKVLKDGINYESVADALSAFPNAVIKAINGFNKEFTVDDFSAVGQKIGNCIAQALMKIEWGTLFTDIFGVANRVLAGLNGALEGFGKNWGDIKDAIVRGIKSVPATEWTQLGVQIGALIFNVAGFVANVVDMLFKAIKAGSWGKLWDGIKQGFDDKIKKEFGSWENAGIALAKWIGENLDVISVIVALGIGSFAMKTGVAALGNLFTGALLPGGKMTFGQWAKNISLSAGILLSLDVIKSALGEDYSHDTFMNFLGTALSDAIKKGSLAGALVGFGLKGFTGGLYGMVIGAGVTLSIKMLKSAMDNFGVRGFLTDLGGGLVGAFVGYAVTGGNLLGALLGFTIGVSLTLAIEKLIPKMKAKTEQYYKDLAKTLGPGYSVDQNGEIHYEWDGDPDHAPNANIVGGTTSKQETGNIKKTETRTTRLGDANAQGVFTMQAALDTSNSKDWLKILNDAWNNIVKNNKVARFFTEGVANKALDWWGSVKEFWSNAIKGKFASKFTIEGIVNQAVTWWSNVQDYWSNVIRGKAAERFNILGIVNSAITWWSNVQGYWSGAISGRTASPFSIAGVVNAATSWWNQTQGYWNDATRNSSLTATVTTSLSSNAIINTFNAAQTWLNNHPITAIVQTQSVTPKISGAVSGVRRADGGVYKNGIWYPITSYASGGFPSGEMFLAREAGPELVGTIGGNTAVMNNDQIVASVSAGVAQAVASVMGGGNTNDIVIKIDSETIYRAVKKGERMANGRYGTVVTVG